MSTSVRNIVILLLVWLVVLWLDLPSIFKHLMLHSHNHMTETTLRDVVQTTLEGLPEEDTPMPTVQHWTPPAGPSVHVHDQYPTPVQTNRIRRRTQDAPMSGATTPRLRFLRPIRVARDPCVALSKDQDHNKRRQQPTTSTWSSQQQPQRKTLIIWS